MKITVTIGDLTARQKEVAVEVLSDINKGQILANEPVYPTLGAWAEFLIKENVKSMIREKDRAKGELRREAWVQADDAKRAQVDAALGI